MKPTVLPLSVLDLAPVVAGGTARQSLNNSVDLAQLAEKLGYRRHWVAEHHNMTGIASSSPAVLAAHLAAATSSLRIGSGGVMLPNHSALTIAEQFGTLEALHPGRIDLGVGRAPGTDQHTAAALRRSSLGSADTFPRQLGELLSYFDGRHPHITATPGAGYKPALWMLGSSDYSAQVAARMGVPFSFAYHFSAANTEPALAAYRENFQPSDTLEQPYVMLGVALICADSSELATHLYGSTALSFTRLRLGRPIQMLHPDEVAAYNWTPAETELRQRWDGSVVVGDPMSVREQLESLVARFQVDELMITTMVFDHKDRRRSYQLLAKEWSDAKPLPV